MSSVKNAWSWFISCFLFLRLFAVEKFQSISAYESNRWLIRSTAVFPESIFKFLSFLTSVQCCAPFLLRFGRHFHHISLLSDDWCRHLRFYYISLSALLCSHMAALSNREFGLNLCLKHLSSGFLVDFMLRINALWGTKKQTKQMQNATAHLATIFLLKTQLKTILTELQFAVFRWFTSSSHLLHYRQEGISIS